MSSFKDQNAYVESERPITGDPNQFNASSLWGEGEKSYLEDVTLNLIPDDDAVKNIKGTTAMKWDAKKKKYMLKKVDRDGRVITERKNESGQKITKKMREK